MTLLVLNISPKTLQEKERQKAQLIEMKNQ